LIIAQEQQSATTTTTTDMSITANHHQYSHHHHHHHRQHHSTSTSDPMVITQEEWEDDKTTTSTTSSSPTILSPPITLPCVLSHDAYTYFKYLLDVLSSPIIFPRCKDFDRQFKALANRGLIIDEWKQSVKSLPFIEQYSLFALTLKHEMYEYDVEFNTYDMEELNLCVQALTQMTRVSSTIRKNLLSLFLNLRGYILFTYLNRIEESIHDFTWAIQLDSSAVDNYASRAWCLYRQRKYWDAVADMERAISLDPAAENYATRGLIYQALSMHKEAVSDCSKALELIPSSTDSLLDRARSLRELQKFEAAAEDYKKVIEIDPRNATAHTCLGYVLLYNLKNYEMAVHYFSRGLEIDDKHSDTYVNRGTAYRLLGKYTEAIADCDRALAVDSRNAIAYNNKGFAYQEQGLYDEAIVQYKRAIEVDPDLATAWFNISRIYFINRRFVEALHYATIAYRLKPSDVLYADDCSYFISLLKEGSDKRVIR
jgi:tetratricopeptide (TPR) repeat protein